MIIAHPAPTNPTATAGASVCGNRVLALEYLQVLFGSAEHGYLSLAEFPDGQVNPNIFWGTRRRPG